MGGLALSAARSLDHGPARRQPRSEPAPRRPFFTHCLGYSNVGFGPFCSYFAGVLAAVLASAVASGSCTSSEPTRLARVSRTAIRMDAAVTGTAIDCTTW